MVYIPDKALNTTCRRYTNADVGLRGDRPFRVCATHWDRDGRNIVPGDDPDASPRSSRALEMYRAQGTHEVGVPPHTHEFHEFVFVQAASGNEHITEEGRSVLARGDVIVVAPGAVHGYSAMAGLSKTDLFIQPQWLSEELRLLWWEGGLVQSLLATALFNIPFCEGVWKTRLEETAFSECEQELAAIVVELKRSRVSLAFCIGSFFKLLSIVNRAHQSADPVERPPLDRQLWLVVTRTEEAIERGDALDAEKLAAEVGMSRRHLDRRFREETGLSLNEYYRNRRIQHATRMLSEPWHSVKEIAHRLNFSDTPHFVRVFKEKTGLSPGAYRREHQTATETAGLVHS